MNSFRKHIYKNNTISQATEEGPASLALDPISAIAIANSPNDIEVEVISNRTWEVGSTDDWFSVTNVTGSGFTITSIEDNLNSARSFGLTVSTNDSNDPFNLTKTFTINQEGELHFHLVAFDVNQSNACSASPDTNVWSDNSTFQNSLVLYKNGNINSQKAEAGFYAKNIGSLSQLVIQVGDNGIVTGDGILCSNIWWIGKDLKK